MFLSRFFKKRPEVPLDPPEQLSILAVCLSLEDRFLLERLADRHGWNIHFVESPGGGFTLASKYLFDVILCDRNQPGYPWREVLDHLSERSPRSCLLLVSPLHDDYLWGEVVQHGGHDIVVRPLRESETVMAIETARLRQWFDAPCGAAARK